MNRELKANNFHTMYHVKRQSDLATMYITSDTSSPRSYYLNPFRKKASGCIVHAHITSKAQTGGNASVASYSSW